MRHGETRSPPGARRHDIGTAAAGQRERAPRGRPWALVGPVLRRARAGWPVLLAAFLVLLASVTLIAAGVVYADSVAAGGVRRVLRDAPPPGQALLVTTVAAPDEVPAADAAARAELHAAMAPTDGSVALVLGSGPWTAAGTVPAAEDAEPPLVRLAAIEDLARHATLVAGAWPPEPGVGVEVGAGAVPVSLSRGAAAALGLAVGDRIALVVKADPGMQLEAEVTAIWTPDATDPFWFGDPLLLTGTESAGSFTTLGPLVLSRDDLLARAALPHLEVDWRALPDLSRLRAEDVPALQASAATADERLRAALRPPPAITVTTDLPATLATVGTSVTVSRAGVLVLTLEFAVLAGYAIVMVGGMLADRRRGDVALLRSRGAGPGALVAMSLLEALLLTLPAMVLAPLLALALVAGVGTVGPLAGSGAIAEPVLTPAVVGATLIAGIGCLVALAAPAVISASSPAGERAATARPVGRGLAGRLGMDLVIVAVAALALWQLRLYGAPLTRDARGSLGIDPLLIAAPALTLLAGALVGTRLLPRSAELLSPAAGRLRGAIVPLVTWGLARRPRGATRAALLLMLAAALGTFAATYEATWARSQEDQAAQLAGADVRAVMSDYPALPAWAVGPALRDLSGVSGAAAVGVRSLDSGRVIRGGTVIATEATNLRAALGARDPEATDAEATGGLAGIATRLADAAPPHPGAELPAGTTGLALTVGGLRTSDIIGLPIDEPVGTIEAVAVTANADGVHRLPLGAVPTTPGPQRISGGLGGSTAAGELSIAAPARLLGVELVVTAGGMETITGELAISDVAALTEAGPVPLDVAPASDAWRWIAMEAGGPARPLDPTATGTIPIATGDASLPPILGSPNPPTTFRLQPAIDVSGAIPAVASDAFLAATGAGPGDTVAATVSGLPVTLRLLDGVAAVPSRDPAEPVVIVDAPTLADAEYLAIGRLAPAREWWLGVDPASAAAVQAALTQPPFGATEATGRASVAATLRADAVALGVIGALALGSIAALVMAAVGFLLSATVSASERLGEFAVLRALGLPGPDLARWLLLESGVTLGFGLVGGVLSGLLLAWLVLPFASLTQTGAPPVPSATLVVPWDTLIPALLGGGLVLLALSAVVTRRIPTTGLGGVLRSRGDR